MCGKEGKYWSVVFLLVKHEVQNEIVLIHGDYSCRNCAGMMSR